MKVAVQTLWKEIWKKSPTRERAKGKGEAGTRTGTWVPNFGPAAFARLKFSVWCLYVSLRGEPSVDDAARKNREEPVPNGVGVPASDFSKSQEGY